MSTFPITRRTFSASCLLSPLLLACERQRVDVPTMTDPAQQQSILVASDDDLSDQWRTPLRIANFTDTRRTGSILRVYGRSLFRSVGWGPVDTTILGRFPNSVPWHVRATFESAGFGDSYLATIGGGVTLIIPPSRSITVEILGPPTITPITASTVAGAGAGWQGQVNATLVPLGGPRGGRPDVDWSQIALDRRTCIISEIFNGAQVFQVPPRARWLTLTTTANPAPAAFWQDSGAVLPAIPVPMDTRTPVPAQYEEIILNAGGTQALATWECEL